MGFLDGRVTIVTAGGGPGMGVAICRSIAAEGAAVVVADIDETRAQEAAEQIRSLGGSALAIEADIASATDVKRLAEETSRRFGDISILVNHAGIVPGGPIESISEEAWDRALGVHLKGAFLCSQAVLPYMKSQGWGRIVNTISRAAYRPSPNVMGLTDYAAAKAGLAGFSRALAAEVGPYGITVNSVAPGIVSGSGMSGANPNISPDAERSASLAEGQVLPPRFVTPDEVAGAILYLLSPQAQRITGTVLHINGGSYFPA